MICKCKTDGPTTVLDAAITPLHSFSSVCV